MKCWKCDLLEFLFNNIKQTNRNYWIITELFVWMHDGVGHCA